VIGVRDLAHETHISGGADLESGDRKLRGDVRRRPKPEYDAENL
jgi:hypothetical protein